MRKGPTFIPLDLRLPSQDDTYQHSPIDYCPLTPSHVAALLRSLHVVDFFDAEVILARHYAAQLHNQRMGQRKIELADELTERMEQINFLCKSVAVLIHRNFAGLSAKPPRLDERKQVWFMMYLYDESFYYFAHRVQCILKKGKAGLPGVNGFVPCKKVTLIRNLLIEHAYLMNTDLELGGNKQVVSLHQGPQIRGRSGNKWPEHLQDHGMFTTARAFQKAVRPVLEQALEAVGGYVDDRIALMAEQRNSSESKRSAIS